MQEVTDELNIKGIRTKRGGRIFIGCNYKDCSKEITFAELHEAGILGSDISALSAPKKPDFIGLFLFSSRYYSCQTHNPV